MASNDALVASLMLLFDGVTPRDAAIALAKALGKRVKVVCTECGSEDVSPTAGLSWDEDIQEWEMQDCDHSWCTDCDANTDFTSVALDWVKPDNWGEKADGDANDH